MKFTEIEAYNLTKKIGTEKKINVPLSSIVTNEFTAQSLPEKALKALEENGIDTTEQFMFAYKRGSLEGIKGLSKKAISEIHQAIDGSISQIPGIGQDTFQLLISKGIKNVKQFNLAYQKDELKMGTPAEDDKIENVKMAVERSIQPSLMRVYHATVDLHAAEYIIDQSWADGPNSQAYGTGLYTCWTESSSFDDIDVYGKKLACPKMYYYENPKAQGKPVYVKTDDSSPILFRFEFLVDVSDYFIFNYDVYKHTHPQSTATKETFIDEQNKKFGTDYHSAQGDFWGYWWKDKKQNPHYTATPKDTDHFIQGIIFNGAHDGDVVVCYNTKRVIPTRVSLGDKHEWFPIGDKSYSSMAMQAAMGITVDNEFWKTFAHIIHKSLDEIMNDYSGARDMEETEFLATNGKSFIITDSDEDETIEAPESDEYNGNNKIFDRFEITNCLHAKHVNMPFKEVNTFVINNNTDPELEGIGSYNNTELIVNEKFIVNRAPKVVLPWSIVRCPNNNGGFKVRRTDLGANFICGGFAKAYFIGVKVGHSFGAVDCKDILVKNVEADEFHLVLDEADKIDNVVLENTKVNKLVIDSTSEDREIGSITFKNGSNAEEVAFNVKGTVSSTIYKNDIESRQISYTLEELLDLSRGTGEEEIDGETVIHDDIGDETGITISNICIE